MSRFTRGNEQLSVYFISIWVYFAHIVMCLKVKVSLLLFLWTYETQKMLKQETEGFDTGSVLRVGSLLPMGTGEAECLDTCAAGCLEKTCCGIFCFLGDLERKVIPTENEGWLSRGMRGLRTEEVMWEKWKKGWTRKAQYDCETSFRLHLMCVIPNLSWTGQREPI